MPAIASARMVLARILDAVVPERCVMCGHHGTYLCRSCTTRYERAPCVCRPATVRLPRVYALGMHEGPLRTAILGCKYRNQQHAARALGALLGPKLTCGIDAVVPVPLHPSRSRTRGYNQAEVIACGMARTCDAMVVTDALERCKATVPQSALHVRDRERNVSDAFIVGPGIDRLRGLRTAIVDDVITTGATIDACAAVLRSAGILIVCAAALALRV